MKFNLKFASSHSPVWVSPGLIFRSSLDIWYLFYFNLANIDNFTGRFCVRIHRAARGLHNRCLSFANNLTCRWRVSGHGPSVAPSSAPRTNNNIQTTAATAATTATAPSTKWVTACPLSANTFSLSVSFSQHFLLTAANSMSWINKCIVVSGLTKSFFSVPNISIKIPKV